MSILDGIYWENEYRKEEERKLKEQEDKKYKMISMVKCLVINVI